MKILVVGSGAREHALLWALRQSPRVNALYVAPGNAGHSALAERVDLAVDDVDGLLHFAESAGIDLTVVGPEGPLVAGIADHFRVRSLAVFGPGADGARIEGSKAWAKQFLQRHGVPTAPFRVFDDPDRAREWVKARPLPLVVKADGLAAGKGVVVAESRDEALDAVDAMMIRREFGDAGAAIVVEDCLAGEELSILVVTDGREVCILPAAQDHKRIGEGDRGPNTGGMGAYAPAPSATPALLERVMPGIVMPVVRGLAAEGITYRGVLFFGLMLTPSGPQVLEINCRFGDPETEAILPLVKGDLAELLDDAARGAMHPGRIETHAGASLSVVLASGGYPGAYRTGVPVRGVEHAEAIAGVIVFHAGTKRGGDGELLTAGGRVLAVTARAETLPAAAEQAYRAVGLIEFDDMIYRRDIGARAMGGAAHGAKSSVPI